MADSNRIILGQLKKGDGIECCGQDGAVSRSQSPATGRACPSPEGTGRRGSWNTEGKCSGKKAATRRTVSSAE